MFLRSSSFKFADLIHNFINLKSIIFIDTLQGRIDYNVIDYSHFKELEYIQIINLNYVEDKELRNNEIFLNHSEVVDVQFKNLPSNLKLLNLYYAEQIKLTKEIIESFSNLEKVILNEIIFTDKYKKQVVELLGSFPEDLVDRGFVESFDNIYIVNDYSEVLKHIPVEQQYEKLLEEESNFNVISSENYTVIE